MGVFYLKRGDTQPVLQVQLINPDKTPHDLSFGSPLVFLHIHLADKVTILSRPMVVIDAVDGQVVYPWITTDWDAGKLVVSPSHLMEYETFRSPGNRMSFPNGPSGKAFDTLHITGDIADGT